MARKPKIQRQDAKVRITAPIDGATIGARMNAAMTSDRMRAIWAPWNRSRMMARPSTAPAPAPIPWITRSVSSVPMSGASAQPTVAIS